MVMSLLTLPPVHITAPTKMVYPMGESIFSSQIEKDCSPHMQKRLTALLEAIDTHGGRATTTDLALHFKMTEYGVRNLVRLAQECGLVRQKLGYYTATNQC